MKVMASTEVTFLTADIHGHWSWRYDTSQNLKEM